MSAEEVVSEALQTPVDQNAQSAEDAQKLLAELQNETPASNGAEPESAVTTEAKEQPEETVQAETKSDNRNGHSERRHDDRERRNNRGDFKGRGRGRGDRSGGKSYRENIKSDVTTQAESSDPVAIRKQVHFYFSDSNLPTDNFLWNATGGPANKPVEIKTLHDFKRMRHFQPFSAIVDALRESTFLELTDDDTKVRRKTPYEAKTEEGPVQARSIYAKGFGDEGPNSQFDIEAFFAKFGPTNAVRLRRSDQKLFKGSVFVEFETEEVAKSFLALDPKPTYQGKELQIMSKKEYCDKKVEDINAGRLRPSGGRFEKSRGDYKGGNKRKHDDGDSRDWRTRRDEDRKRDFKGGRGRNNGHGGGRSRGTDVDDRGIPTVKGSLPKDSGKEDAIAKAKAAVQAELKKESDESKKRPREDDGEAERDAKKVDTKSEVEATS
ncbi:hypothetical protein PV10_00935 [Exophiala mesophila]|uniref:Lupus La protein n=1 Tax=Exophiala mesophila TaxID=212818 RepID=A0A0D2AE36_EXOME|nr:uncharacterized protein PV10_00935 [Exophiala mesophila]KIV97153.1 hypothetical protein PV10_00935 [Exophiala mesophila]